MTTTITATTTGTTTASTIAKIESLYAISATSNILFGQNTDNSGSLGYMYE